LPTRATQPPASMTILSTPAAAVTAAVAGACTGLLALSCRPGMRCAPATARYGLTRGCCCTASACLQRWVRGWLSMRQAVVLTAARMKETWQCCVAWIQQAPHQTSRLVGLLMSSSLGLKQVGSWTGVSRVVEGKAQEGGRKLPTNPLPPFWL
jgi:hypothetical protein